MQSVQIIGVCLGDYKANSNQKFVSIYCVFTQVISFLRHSFIKAMVHNNDSTLTNVISLPCRVMLKLSRTEEITQRERILKAVLIPTAILLSSVTYRLFLSYQQANIVMTY
jgi:hypothetical protein